MIDSKTLQTTRTWDYPEQLRFAVPLDTGKRFLIVSGSPGNGPVNLSLFTPNEGDIDIATADDIGMPTISPGGSEIAWVMKHKDGKTSLNITQLGKVTKMRTLAGPFAVDNAGPSWMGGDSAAPQFIIALSTGAIARVDLQREETTALCQGELPVLLADSQEVVFTRGQHLWVFDLSDKSETSVLEVGYIAGHYRSCLLTENDSYLLYHSQAHIPDGPFPHHTYSTLFLVDLASKQKTPISQRLPLTGPWAWLPSEVKGAK